MGKINMQKISKEDYLALPSIDKYTVYWLTDGTIYVGNQLHGGKFQVVESDPINPEVNTLYINFKEDSLKIFNGEELKSLNINIQTISNKEILDLYSKYNHKEADEDVG